MSSCCGPEAASRAGAAAVPCTVVETADFSGAGCGCGSGSRMSAPSPRPKAFLGIVDDLLGELAVSLRALAVNVVKNDWLAKTRRFGKSHIARNHALEDLRPKKAAQIRGDLARKSCALVIHREQNAFDLQSRI